jgi:hypothetical protein
MGEKDDNPLFSPSRFGRLPLNSGHFPTLRTACKLLKMRSRVFGLFFALAPAT